MIGSHSVMESPGAGQPRQPADGDHGKDHQRHRKQPEAHGTAGFQESCGGVHSRIYRFACAGVLIPSPSRAVKEVKMSRRAKTLIAAILIVFFWLPFYALFIIGLARHVLPGAPWYLALLFYALSGTLWIVPIGLSLPWMHREPAGK